MALKTVVIISEPITASPANKTMCCAGVLFQELALIELAVAGTGRLHFRVHGKDGTQVCDTADLKDSVLTIYIAPAPHRAKMFVNWPGLILPVPPRDQSHLS